MSLILDALRKSDRQRNRQATEQLRWGPGPARSAHRQHSPWLAGMSLLLLLAIVIAGTWLGTRLATPTVGGTPDTSVAATTAPELERQRSRPTSTASAAERDQVRSLSGELVVAETASGGTGADEGIASGSTNGGAGSTREQVLIAPSLAAMPESFRASLPELNINVHAWAEAPRERFVLINMRRYAEGEQLREGPTLLQITQDGAVLEYRNERFTLTQR